MGHGNELGTLIKSALDGVTPAETTEVPWQKICDKIIDYLGTRKSTVDPVATNDSSTQVQVGHKWINTTTGRTWICKDNTVNNAVWEEIPTAGGTPLGKFERYRIGGQSSDGSETSVKCNYESFAADSKLFSAITNSDLQVDIGGLYKLNYSVNLQNTGLLRACVRVRLKNITDGTYIDQTEAYCYIRLTEGRFNTISKEIHVSLVAGKTYGLVMDGAFSGGAFGSILATGSYNNIGGTNWSLTKV